MGSIGGFACLVAVSLTLLGSVWAGNVDVATAAVASFSPEYAAVGQAFVLTVHTPGGLPGVNPRQQRIALVKHLAPCQGQNMPGVQPSSLALREPVAASGDYASWDVIVDSAGFSSDAEDIDYDVCYCAGVACFQSQNFVRLEQPGILSITKAQQNVAPTVNFGGQGATGQVVAEEAARDESERQHAAEQLARLRGAVDRLGSEMADGSQKLWNAAGEARQEISEGVRALGANVTAVAKEVSRAHDKLRLLDQNEASLRQELTNAKQAEDALYHGEMALEEREGHAAARERAVATRDERYGSAIIARADRALGRLHNVTVAQSHASDNLVQAGNEMTSVALALHEPAGTSQLGSRLTVLERAKKKW